MTSPASLNAWKHHLDLDSLLFSFDVQAKCFKVVERAVQKSTLSTRVFNPSLTRTYRPHGVIESTCRHVSIQNHLHSSFWLHADGSLNYPEGAAVYMENINMDVLLQDIIVPSDYGRGYKCVFKYW